MNIRMICMDLDGTALGLDHKSFSPRLEAALERAHERGILIVPVTGRQFGLLPDCLTPPPAWADAAVLCNGGQARKMATGEVLYRLDIEQSELYKLRDLAEQFDLPIEFSVDSRLHLTKRSFELQQGWPGLEFHLGTILPKCGIIVDGLDPVFEQAVEKVNLLCIPAEKREAVEAALREINVCAVWASATSMEITHPDASKGNGLQALCRMFGVPAENVMALGDSGNDESMLRAAGLGIAMGNAPEPIKAIADAVTETNENDGAAIAIERWCLKDS